MGCIARVKCGNLWAKLWETISVPGRLEEKIQQRVDELQAQEADASAECEKLEKRLDDIPVSRKDVQSIQAGLEAGS